MKESFLQVVKERWKLPKEKVAVFGSWDMFHYIAESRRGEIFINAGYEASTLPADNPRVAELNKLQLQARYMDDSARHDAFTFGLAMEYLKSVQPRVLFVAFDETDDWAHARRYDQVLRSIQFLDGALQELWTWVQGSRAYRDATTLIVTCDHGRGGTLDDWHSHGKDTQGADQVWIAVFGPDTPHRGEAVNTDSYHQRDIAATALELLGIGAGSYPGVLRKPIGAVIDPSGDGVSGAMPERERPSLANAPRGMGYWCTVSKVVTGEDTPLTFAAIGRSPLGRR